MIHYDHALLGATLAVAAGAHRRHGWPLVAAVALGSMLPDWDSLSGSYGPDAHRAVHRVWGHNLWAAAAGGALVGGLGWLCVRAARVRAGRPAPRAAPEGGVWMLAGLLAALGHVAADVVFSAEQGAPDWPVALFWPLSRWGLAVPLMTCEDRGPTAILVTGLAASALRPAVARALACLTLLALATYVAARAALGGPGP